MQKMHKMTSHFYDMRKILTQNFWSHGTYLGSLGPWSQKRRAILLCVAWILTHFSPIESPMRIFGLSKLVWLKFDRPYSVANFQNKTRHCKLIILYFVQFFRGHSTSLPPGVSQDHFHRTAKAGHHIRGGAAAAVAIKEELNGARYGATLCDGIADAEAPGLRQRSGERR